MSTSACRTFSAFAGRVGDSSCRIEAAIGLVSSLLWGCSADDTCPASDSECSGETSVTTVIGEGQVTPALAASAILSANGTYGAGCTLRSGSWSVLVNPAATPDNPLLSVVKSNAACSLTLTSIRTGTTPSDLYLASPSIALTGAYAASGSTFSVTEGGPVAFDGNARLNAVGFLTDFVVGISFSGSGSATSSDVATYSYSAEVLSDSPISYWRLGEASGTTAVDRMARSNGTYSGGYTQGVSGALINSADTAVDLNGATGKINVPAVTAYNFTTGLSIEAWVRPDSVTLERYVLNKGLSYFLYVSSGEMVFGVQIGLVAHTVSASVATGSWQHFVGTYDGASLILYRNGINVTQVAQTGTVATSLGPIVIGSDGLLSFFDGKVDEVAVYNVALSSSRVATHYARGTSLPP